jgi:hypothetical protein|eukprot:COSAG06_NODE_6963_length_2695_cov_1.823960_3_plen_99_part_00
MSSPEATSSYWGARYTLKQGRSHKPWRDGVFGQKCKMHCTGCLQHLRAFLREVKDSADVQVHDTLPGRVWVLVEPAAPLRERIAAESPAVRAIGRGAS